LQKKTDLFDKVLAAFHREGALPSLVLVGSWCKVIYRQYFSNAPEIPALRTTDIDFLIPGSRKTAAKVDLAGLLISLGFETEYSLIEGYPKFVHPDLEIEFLTPETGPSKRPPVVTNKQLNITAQKLRFLSILQDHTLMVNYRRIPVTVPQPAAFVLHKFIVFTKRIDRDKAHKDLSDAVQIGEFLLTKKEQRILLAEVFSSLLPNWKKTLLKNCGPSSDAMSSFLKSIK
jgi:hypothetical protein